MKKQVVVTVLMLFSLLIQALGCQCLSKKELNEARESEYNQSDVILIVDVQLISEDNSKFQVSVLEIFKGHFDIGQTMQGLNNIYCEPHIDSTGKWLVYGKIEDGLLTINECGLSRSFDNPELNSYFRTLLPPPPRDSTYDKYELQKRELELRQKDKINAIEELENELQMLRKKKLEASVQQQANAMCLGTSFATRYINTKVILQYK